MTIIFFEQKYAALTLATKIFKNQDYHLFLPKGMQHTALVGKTMVRGGRYSAGNRRALNRLKREEGGKDTRDGTPHKITRDLF